MGGPIPKCRKMTTTTTPKRKKRKPYGFDPAFEQGLITASIIVREVYERVGSGLAIARLHAPEAKVCLQALKWSVQKHGSHPGGIEPILQRIEELCTEERKISPEDAAKTKAWLSYVDRDSLPDTESLIKTAGHNIKARMLEDVVEDISDGDNIETDELTDRIEAAGRVGQFNNNPGIDWNDSTFDEAFLDLPNVHRIPFGITQLDEYLEGGYGQGHFGLILAGTNAGKSFFLVNTAVAASLQGYDVAYATLEMNEHDTYTRAFSCLTGVPLTNIKISKEARKLCIKRRQDILKHVPMGNIRVKFFDAGTTSIDDITGWVESEDRRTKKNHQVVIIDYLDKVGPGRGSKKTDNSYVTYGNIFERFRLWCLKNQKYGLSASQSKNLMSGNKRKMIDNPEGIEKKNPQLTSEDISDSLNKSRVVDVIVGLTESFITVVKNRHGPCGGVVQEFTKPTSVGCIHPDYVSIGMRRAGLV